MTVTLTSTSKVVTLETPDGSVPARVWEGRTSKGIECHAFITRIAVHKDDDASEFERDLKEHEAPTPAIRSIPLRMII